MPRRERDAFFYRSDHQSWDTFRDDDVHRAVSTAIGICGSGPATLKLVTALTARQATGSAIAHVTINRRRSNGLRNSPAPQGQMPEVESMHASIVEMSLLARTPRYNKRGILRHDTIGAAHEPTA